MGLIKMQCITSPYYYSHAMVPTPGANASVGETNLSVRLKQSMPDMPFRYEPWTAGINEVSLGSNVQNGQQVSYVSGGGPARTMPQKRQKLVCNGWRMQDLRAPDTLHEPLNIGTPQYSWNNKVATSYEIRRTGEKFLPLPFGYMQNAASVPRGGVVPRVTATVDAGDSVDRVIQTATNPLTGKPMPLSGQIDATPERKSENFIFPSKISR